MKIKQGIFSMMVASALMLNGSAYAELPDSGLRAIALLNEADVDSLKGVDGLASQGVQIIVLQADRLTNIASEVQDLQMRLSMATDAALASNSRLKEYMLDQSISEDKRTEALTALATDSPVIRSLTDELEEVSKKFSLAFPEARAIGELSTKLNVTDAPSIIFEDIDGYKIVAGTLSLEYALETAIRSDYDELK